MLTVLGVIIDRADPAFFGPAAFYPQTISGGKTGFDSNDRIYRFLIS